MMSGYDYSRNHLVKTAGITASMSAAGAVAGLSLDALILFWFGAGAQTDAYFAALVIPTLLIGILSIQLPKILVPVFGALFRSQEDEAWRLLRNLLTIGGLLFAGVVIVGNALAGLIMPLQVPGLEPGAIALTVRLSRVVLWLVWFQGLSSVLQAVLYARHSYAVSSAAKLVINAVTIGVVLGVGRGHLGISVLRGVGDWRSVSWFFSSPCSPMDSDIAGRPTNGWHS